MSVVSMKQLLEAGVHFGHQTRRWNPKMAEYIFTERNGIYIIDLQKTVKKLEEAYMFVREATQDGGEILFVGTKKQAQLSIKEEAQRCGMPYVDARWLGGMLTNFTTIRRRIDRLNQLRKMREDGTFELLPKKEVIKLNAEIEKLEKFLGGIDVCENAFGADKIAIAPVFAKSVDRVKVTYRTVRGLVVSGWERKGNTVSLHVEIPPQTTACLTLAGEEKTLSSGKYDFEINE